MLRALPARNNVADGKPTIITMFSYSKVVPGQSDHNGLAWHNPQVCKTIAMEVRHSVVDSIPLSMMLTLSLDELQIRFFTSSRPETRRSSFCRKHSKELLPWSTKSSPSTKSASDEPLKPASRPRLTSRYSRHPLRGNVLPSKSMLFCALSSTIPVEGSSEQCEVVLDVLARQCGLAVQKSWWAARQIVPRRLEGVSVAVNVGDPGWYRGVSKALCGAGWD